jgi:AcrR family transcriptional regulator
VAVTLNLMSSVRTRILSAVAELIAQSPDLDVSTRAVCDAAGVSAPSIYHHFGDKDRLLAAAVDYGWETFMASKREAAARPRQHVADDLRDGWDNHLQFARDHPGLYRLLWFPGVSANSDAARQSHEMLRAVLEVGASRGQLRVSPATATQIIMAAVAGAALSVISQPELFDDTLFASHLRDAVIERVTVPAQKEHPSARKRPKPREPSLASAAATLQIRLGNEPNVLTEAERLLMHQWLMALADTLPHNQA